jgi:peroxiredoxin Q/BCP
MKFRLLVAGFLVCLAANFASADNEGTRYVNIRVGDKPPAFACHDDVGRVWQSRDHYGRKALVVSFVMGDFFPECTRQACELRDELKELRAQGAELVLVSGDTVATHRLFKRAYRLNYPLLSDPEGKVGREWGLPMSGGGVRQVKLPDGKEVSVERGATAARWTFVVGKDGKVIYRKK